jgi:hypothetical protein
MAAIIPLLLTLTWDIERRRPIGSPEYAISKGKVYRAIRAPQGGDQFHVCQLAVTELVPGELLSGLRETLWISCDQNGKF